MSSNNNSQSQVSSVFYPSTPSEGIIYLNSQMVHLTQSVDRVWPEVAGVKKEIKEVNERLSDIEVRLSVDERDKKILIGAMIFIVPIFMAILEWVVF